MNSERLRRVERWIGAAASVVLTDMAGLGGAGLVAYGAWTLNHAAGLMAGGVLLLTAAWLSARNG